MKLFIAFTMCLGVFIQGVQAAEVTIPQQPNDWAKAHRQTYQQYTLTKSGPEMISALPGVPTFVSAANHNIKLHLRTSIRQYLKEMRYMILLAWFWSMSQ